MLFLSKIVSALLIAYGSMVAVKTSYMRQILEYMRVGKRIYLAAILRVVMGAVLISASPEARIDWWFMLVGLLCVWGALIIFVMKLSVLKDIIDWWLSKERKYLTLAGAITALVGLCLLLAV